MRYCIFSILLSLPEKLPPLLESAKAALPYVFFPVRPLRNVHPFLEMRRALRFAH